MNITPVSYKDGTLVLDSKLMDVDQPYWLLFRNLRTCAIKRADGSVEFYRIPRWLAWLERWLPFRDQLTEL